jgi:uncharacterized membrane protein
MLQTRVHTGAAAGQMAIPEIRKISTSDVLDALRHGFEDFWARRTMFSPGSSIRS